MSRMFRALVRKEWRQLRGLRWVGLLLGLGLPAIMLTAAEGARQGLLPFGHLESYSMESLFLDAFPLGLLALWGLVGLLVGAQSFAADRMDGTETFLLERPISRRRIWEARWLASLGSLMSVVVAQFVFWCLLGWVTTGIEPSRWTLGPGLMAVLGVGIALTSIVGAGLAA